MAASIASPTVQSIADPDRRPTDHPGRWVGGVVGVVAALTTAGAAGLIGRLLRVDLEMAETVAVTGVPVAFLLGRAFLPTARKGGLTEAMATGLLLGWIAPPMGAALVLGSFGLAGGVTECGTETGALVAIGLYPIAAVFSFLAIVVTIPAGFLWGLIVAFVPDHVLERARLPEPITSLGARHLFALIGSVYVLVAALQLATPLPPCPGPW
jgi:hypothetical protein